MSLQVTILIQQANELIEKADYAAAYEIVQKAISLDTTDNYQHIELALTLAHERLGLHEDVINYANILLAHETQHKIQLQRAWTYYDTQQYDAALADFQAVFSATEVEQERLNAQSGRGLCYYMFNRYEEAVIDLQTAINYYPRWSVGTAYLGWALYYVSDYNTAKMYFSQAITLQDEPYGFAYGGRGLVHYELNDYDMAITDLTISLAENNVWAQGFATRGWCYQDIGFYQNQYELALADFNRAIELMETDYSYALAGRALACFELKQFTNCIRDLKIALLDNQTWARGYAVYGWALLETEAYEEALSMLEKAITLAKDDEPYIFAHAGRGLTYFELHDLTAAKADITMALAANKTWIRGQAVLAWIYYETAQTQAEYEAALALFDTALADTEQYAFGYGGRGLVHYELQNYAAAISDLDSSLSINPTWGRGLAVRGWSKYFLAQDQAALQAALVDFNLSAAQQEPPSPFVLAGRGFTQYRLKAYEAAITDLEIAMTHYNKWQTVYLYLARSLEYTNQLEAAITVLTLGIQTFQEKAGRFYHDRGLLYEDMAQYTLAVQDYEMAVKLDGASWSYGSLASMYQKGRGVPQNLAQAFTFFRKAYDVQYEKDHCEYFDAPLITCYYYGIGVVADKHYAEELVKFAIKHNNQDEKFLLLLAYYYYHGIFFTQSNEQAQAYIEKVLKTNEKNVLAWYYIYVLEHQDEQRQQQALQQIQTHINTEKELATQITENLTKQPPEWIYPLFIK